MKIRASKGGEIGINGEAYEGGQFLPSSPDTVKGAVGNAETKEAKAYMSRKQQVAPYQWETPPSENVVAIFPLLSGIEMFDRETKTFSLNTNFTGGNVEKRTANIAAFNSGQKWTGRG